MNVVDDTVTVDDLVHAVKTAIVLAGISGADADRTLTVTSLRLTLNTVVTETKGGGVDFRVPVIGTQFAVDGSLTSSKTHRLEMTLVPPKIRHEVRGVEIEHLLFEAIRTVRAVVELAAQGDDPFVLDSGTVEFSFAVTRAGTISLGLRGELKNELTHTLQLTLGPAL